MYQVAICEDEKIFSEAHIKICRDIFNKLNIDCHISAFDNSADFLKAYSGGQKRYNLILLDIVMDGINGMELARMVRESDEDATIIFVTSSSEYALQGYDVKALHYLMKPVDSDRLERLIWEDYQNKFQSNFFMFKSGSQNLRIPINDILVLETVGRRVEITLPDKTHSYSGKLTELLDQLPKERFVRCHQAFAVNIDNIRELTRQDAVTVTGKTIPVSRTFMKDTKKAFLKRMEEL